MNDWRWSRIGWTGVLAGSVLYAGALVLLARAGAAAGGPLAARAAAHPGWWGVAYLLQGLSDLCWCLLPLAVWDRFRAQVPNRALVSAVIGVAGFFSLAELALARSGGLAFLATLYASGSSLNQGLAAELAQWQQLWLFGGSWEAVADILAFGLWLALTGAMISGVQREAGGKLLGLVGAAVALSLSAGLGLRLFRVALAPAVGLPGSIIVLIAPVWLLWVMWTISRPAA